MKDGIKIGVMGVLCALAGFVAMYFSLSTYWMERDNYEKQEIPHYKSAAYTSSVLNLCLTILAGVVAILMLMFSTWIIYDTTRTKWLRKKRLQNITLEFEKRMNALRLGRVQQAGDEQVADEKDADEQVADEEHNV